MGKFRQGIFAAAAASVLAAGAPALGQGSDNVLVYKASSFPGVTPTDAWEILRRIPGFTLIEGDEDVRGFAGASGNVLIEGKPPASKQETIEELLRRIPAAAVERIEIIRGGAPGIDMGGHAVVANIVRKRQVIREASAELGVVAAERLAPFPTLALEASQQSNRSRLQFAASALAEIDDETGLGFVTSAAPGDGEERVERSYSEVARILAGSGEYERPMGGGTVTANGSLRRQTTRTAIDTDETVRQRERLTSLELGARYRRDLSGSTYLEALALRRTGRLRARENSVEDEETEQFRENTRTSETIGRVSVRHERPDLALEAAAEGASNTLDSRTSLEDDGVQVELPGSDAHVSERRAEASLAATWTATPQLTIEGTLAAEISRIRSTGDAPTSHSFLFLKPRLAASYSRGHDQIRLVLQREVGQLDFDDFVASASLERGEVSAGALSLRPPRTWSLAATWEHRFWYDGAIVATARYERIEDVIDRVAVVDDGEIFDAVGNIGSGSRLVGEFELTLPLGRLGLEGLRVESSLTVVRGRVTDPTTGVRRPISEDKPIEGEIGFEHDLPGGALSWGAKLSLAERERKFRFDEVRLEREAAQLGMHVDYRPAPRWRLRLEAENLTGALFSERREKYDGLRSSYPASEIERRFNHAARRIMLTVRRSLGGR